MKIRNQNEKYGLDVVVEGNSLEAAVEEMQRTIRACGSEFADIVVREGDYDVVDDEHQLKWELQQPKPAPEPSMVVEIGNIRLAVTPKTGECWQHFLMSFGEYAADSTDDCMATWPREALRLAREALDKFESQLEGES